MVKKEIIDVVANKSGYTKKDITIVVDAFLDAIAAVVASGEDVKLSKFGTFECVDKDARTALNPRTGEVVNVDAKRTIKFKAASALKDAVNA